MILVAATTRVAVRAEAETATVAALADTTAAAPAAATLLSSVAAATATMTVEAALRLTEADHLPVQTAVVAQRATTIAQLPVTALVLPLSAEAAMAPPAHTAQDQRALELREDHGREAQSQTEEIEPVKAGVLRLSEEARRSSRIKATLRPCRKRMATRTELLTSRMTIV